MTASRIIMGALVALVGGATVMFSFMGVRPTRQSMKVPLQEAIAYQDGRFLRVFGVCEIIDSGGNQTAVDKAFVVVEEYGVEYGPGSVVLQSPRIGKVSSSGTLVTPTWRGKYIPTSRQCLPSARVFSLSGKVYVVMFDGRSLTVHVADPKARIERMTETDHIDRIAGLDALIARSFDVDDVYWSYTITGGEQFWKKDREEGSDAPLLIERIYSVWKDKMGETDREQTE
jgi:hypothetical protein